MKVAFQSNKKSRPFAQALLYLLMLVALPNLTLSALLTNKLPEQSSYPGTNSAIASDFAFPQFDPSLGQLRAILLDYSSPITCDVIVLENGNASPRSVDAIWTNIFIFSGPGFQPKSGGAFRAHARVPAQDRADARPEQTTITFRPFSPISVPVAYWSNYIGQGTVAVKLEWLPFARAFCGGSSECPGIRASPFWDMSATVTASYIYEPSPFSISAFTIDHENLIINLTWQAVPGVRYVVERAELFGGSWIPVITNMSAEGTTSFPRQSIASEFYRVVFLGP